MVLLRCNDVDWWGVLCLGFGCRMEMLLSFYIGFFVCFCILGQLFMLICYVVDGSFLWDGRIDGGGIF